MTEHKSVFLSWQSPDNRQRHVVGILTEYSDHYTFAYTKGALASKKFIPFSGMRCLHKTYASLSLFPLFQNRLLSPKRPEYPRFIEWLGLQGQHLSPITILGRSEGVRATDQLKTFNRIEIDDDGAFEHIFFAYRLKELPQSVMTLTAGEALYFRLDRHSDNGINITGNTGESAGIVGYCPWYLANDIGPLLLKQEKQQSGQDMIELTVKVERLTATAPNRYKLMCKVVGRIDRAFISEFREQPEYQLVTDEHYIESKVMFG